MLLRPHNRGLLLDIVVFAFNLLLVRLLMVRFVAMLRSAEDGDVISGWVLFLFILGIFFLPPIGATLKRWQYYRPAATIKRASWIMIWSAVCSAQFRISLSACSFLSLFETFILQYFYGDNGDDGTPMLVGTVLNLPVSAINTWLVFRFFSKPKKEPIFAFLKTPLAGLIGDVCIFVNMIFYQLIWNLLSRLVSETRRRHRVFCPRDPAFGFSLLIYFPPRMFYLADDIDKRRTWLMILLANLPIIIRVMVGTARDGITGW